MGTFRKLKLIGSGGFGEVWRGVRTANDEQVAIKYLLADDDDSIFRFQREVRCLESLNHPNVVRVLGKKLSELPCFYVMPLYETPLFEQFPDIVGNTERIRKIFGSVLEAMRYSHSEGVIHRDLKPENVLMNGDGEVVVSDFGLGRNVNSESSRLTSTGRMLGTWSYCAPEQLMDAKRADERSDIFSLGRMLYDLYGGLNSGIQDLSAVPVVMASIIEKATARNPDARYQNIAEMIEAFRVGCGGPPRGI
jgi:serine/threonine protein kinase